MLRLMLLLAGLGDLLALGAGSQSSFLQIVVPEKIQANTSGNSEVENEQISYIITTDEKPYTIHLKQRFFLAHNFMVYLYNQGSVNSHPSDIQAQCYYQGHIEGYPNSVVTLSTCSGLRGILQFENVSYGIEPLESAVEYQHLLYKLRNENTEDKQGIEEQNKVDYNIFVSEKPESAVPDLIPLYLEIHIVVDKALYDYLGSDSMIVTNKVIEIVGLVNSMFAQFKVTVVLSSLELWSDKNKISTVGEADEVLHRFLEWKKFYLTVRPHDTAYLFMYRDYQDYMGATIPGKMCVTHYSAGIALYPKEITLEAFSIIVTQLLGLSLGISYDDTKKCHCSGAICIMNPEAMRSSGVKTFSSCSLSDFENFISNMGAKCLQNKPQMQTAPTSICGNGRVEEGEVCDCGTEEQCGAVSCCNFRTCTLKPGSQCDAGLCCTDCQIERSGVQCRGARHHECDIAEFCNGSSSECPVDVTIHNGRTCKNQYMCYDGGCQDTDARCEIIFGKGSKNAPFACYEEIHSQTDRFGNCGLKRGQYIFCSWRDLQCGRLICTYPTRVPFYKENSAVIYAFVRNSLCITIDYKLPHSKRDPMEVPSGSFCDEDRICVNRECLEARMLRAQLRFCSEGCGEHGVCTSQGTCHCFDGYQPPYCQRRGREASSLSGKQGLTMESAFRKAEKNRWLLGFYIALPVLIIVTIIAVSWNSSKKWFNKEEESLSSDSEGSTHTFASRSRSESSSQTDTVRSRSESSAQTYTSRSKSQESTQTHNSSN
ncbi:disintegrin and metalloproteinase domain-containing protein 32 isoform X3 [Canis lupus baileyi]|uniref:ADAM metallopeptidase domain 9 n=1 Tax=Canis lupus familiaris TaxID=9615 RepID=A0A8I3NHM2_CANLF|nr:disintegrin and metalloproteinase domain-containing protein 32 isoform X2 [Canis lupus dingo]XP_038415946.1 disintegrin and metalloproteinase domain-containing protein 32 isoform X2 [Canis lupus familiaris]XP_038545741.1 disintegrin and metalloproteinase domain-containing protein 32 isoform X2 [Canis lupus familiaris]XP_532797.3 disintegrin and metalloproteinase domain-containing protein 32 isoform X2 [Canis lupus familiaris]|eukprot:XP_532797.3 disintegrin and metalloproteinase domain-containing protein 32 isoform X3 [Canis lupus familiaris]